MSEDGVVRKLPVVAITLGLACVSIGSFVAQQLQPNPAPWEPVAVNHATAALLVLAVALTLAIERRPSVVAMPAQVVASAVTLGFVIVALCKLYGSARPNHSWFQALQWSTEAGPIAVAALALGLAGLRLQRPAVRLGLASAACVAVGCAGYALSLESDFRAEVWYWIATAIALLAGSAAARLQTGD